MLAADKDALHARSGDAALFIDERGRRINGQWQGSPTPNQHDILTGSTVTGMLMAGNTCGDWTGRYRDVAGRPRGRPRPRYEARTRPTTSGQVPTTGYVQQHVDPAAAPASSIVSSVIRLACRLF